MKPKIYAAIDALQFADLCAGKHVTLDGVGDGEHHNLEIILSDIGFPAMQDAVNRAVHRAQDDEQA
jgi:hypothetical protein